MVAARTAVNEFMLLPEFVPPPDSGIVVEAPLIFLHTPFSQFSVRLWHS